MELSVETIMEPIMELSKETTMEKTMVQSVGMFMIMGHTKEAIVEAIIGPTYAAIL